MLNEQSASYSRNNYLNYHFQVWNASLVGLGFAFITIFISILIIIGTYTLPWYPCEQLQPDDMKQPSWQFDGKSREPNAPQVSPFLWCSQTSLLMALVVP